MIFKEQHSQTQFITQINGVNISLKREDMLHPEVSGNKFRKLKYNLAAAKNLNKNTLLTFGGAFSNHIAATAAAAKLEGLKSIGIIRGDELAKDIEITLKHNKTLNGAFKNGMKLIFIDRETYRKKEDLDISELLKEMSFCNEDFVSEVDKIFVVPEGGTNELAVKGCTEILEETDSNFNYVACPVGTGGTIAGIINSSAERQKILGFPALKGDFLTAEITKFTTKTNWELITDFHFGGYGKITDELVTFMNDFKQMHNILLDPVYTAKMLFGIWHMAENGYFRKDDHVLAIHTGGLQGIEGMNRVLSKKGMQTIMQ